MARLSKILIAATLLAVPSIALADGDPPADGAGGGAGGDATAGGTATGDATTATPAGGDTAAPAAGPAMLGCVGVAGYPQAVIDRPRALCKGELEATLDVPILVKPSPVQLALAIGARYGLAPKLDAQLTYGFALKEFEIKGDLGVAAQYDLAESAKMGAAVRITTGYSVLAKEFDGVGLGVNFLYRITPKIGLFTPGDQLTMGGADFPKPVAINLPVGVTFQANPQINASLTTSIGTIGLSPSGHVLISDITPLTLSVIFAQSNKLDVGAALSFLDLQHAGDFVVLGLHAAIRM